MDGDTLAVTTMSIMSILDNILTARSGSNKARNDDTGLASCETAISCHLGISELPSMILVAPILQDHDKNKGDRGDRGRQTGGPDQHCLSSARRSKSGPASSKGLDVGIALLGSITMIMKSKKVKKEAVVTYRSWKEAVIGGGLSAVANRAILYSTRHS